MLVNKMYFYFSDNNTIAESLIENLFFTIKQHLIMSIKPLICIPYVDRRYIDRYICIDNRHIY